MHVRLKKNRSGSISVIVVDKSGGRYKELHTVGIAKDESEITPLRQKGLEWIRQRELEMHPELDLYGEDRMQRYKELSRFIQLCLTFLCYFCLMYFFSPLMKLLSTDHSLGIQKLFSTSAIAT